MAQSREIELLKQLAAEVIEAFGETPLEKSAPISAESLAESLAKRRTIMSLIKEAGSSTLEVKSEDDDKDVKFLESRYNKAQDEVRRLETHVRDVEEAFGELSVVLASLAQHRQDAHIIEELKKLKKNLKKKAVPNRIRNSAKTLRNALMTAGEELPEEQPRKSGWFGFLKKGENEAEAVDAVETEKWGGIEENVREILIQIVRDISLFEQEGLQRKAAGLAKKISLEFTIEEYKDFAREIQELIFQVKEVLNNQRREMIRFTNDIMSRLEDTEKDFLKTLDEGSKHIDLTESEFSKEVENDIRSIEASFQDEALSLDKVRERVLGKITSIRERFRRKRAEDEARLKQMEQEKAGAEERLQDIHRRYQDFAQQSRTMLQEMEKFRQASLSDSLTKVYNRRAYDAQIKKALDALKNGGLKSFSLVIFDIDHFKDFNNTYGHRAGDKILAHVARIVKSLLRKEDFVARYGGDEFAVILPEVELKAAVKIAEKIRSGVNDVEFKIYKEHDLTVQVGLSIGVGQGRESDAPAAVFQRADKALYLSKEKGRNRVQSEKDIR